MRSWITEPEIYGRARSAQERTPLMRAGVYFDHPLRLPADRPLIIDLSDGTGTGTGTGGGRVGVELTTESAWALIRAAEGAPARGEAEYLSEAVSR
ncbi:conserved hypothetical protein [Frankia sp. Hr75.2]|nr:conserved hypothetical protein [Frankia sp. Hr75.2]